jgi:hypothetical protein
VNNLKSAPITLERITVHFAVELQSLVLLTSWKPEWR